MPKTTNPIRQAADKLARMPDRKPFDRDRVEAVVERNRIVLALPIPTFARLLDHTLERALDRADALEIEAEPRSDRLNSS